MNVKSRIWFVVKGTLLVILVLAVFVSLIVLGGRALLNGPAGTYIYTGQIDRLEYSPYYPGQYTVHLVKISVNGCDLTSKDPCVKKAREDDGFAIPQGSEKNVSLSEKVSIKCVVSPFDIHDMMPYLRGPVCQLEK